MKTFYENFSYSFSIEESGGITFAPHLHKHVELFYITGGELEVTISGAKTLLRAGDAVVAFPHEIHSYRTPESSRYYMLLFTMDCAPDYADVLTHRRPLEPGGTRRPGFSPGSRLASRPCAAKGSASIFVWPKRIYPSSSAA